MSFHSFNITDISTDIIIAVRVQNQTRNYQPAMMTTAKDTSRTIRFNPSSTKQASNLTVH